MMGEKISKLMQEKNISNTKLAEVAGTSDVFIGYVLKGFKTPSVAVLKNIADFLEVTVDELID